MDYHNWKRRNLRLLTVLIVLFPLVTTIASPGVAGGAPADLYERDPAKNASEAAGPSPQSHAGPLWGYADLHAHQFGNLGLGGLAIFGDVFRADDDITRALPWSDFIPGGLGEVVSPLNPLGVPGLIPWRPGCPPLPAPCFGFSVHGAFGTGDLLNPALGGAYPHAVGGYPEFDGYPRWNTYTAQQMYYSWLERAWQSGLRLMVMLAVNNETLCGLIGRKAAFGCDDMQAVDRQIQGAKDLEAFIDAKSGGPGQGWYRIAYSGAQARQIIASGKLAVVLGAEVPSLFGCKPNNAACDEDWVRSELQRYHDMGIRHLFPIHNADNKFGGTALYNDIFAFSNKLTTGDWWDVTNQCDTNPASTEDNLDFHLTLLDDINNAASDVTGFIAGLNPVWGALVSGTLAGAGALPPRPPAGPNCNARGLTALGEVLINEMIDNHMIIDIDHTSGRTFDDILDIAEQRHYPAIASGHTGIVDLGINGHRHEGNKTPEQLERIREIGGLVAVILHQGDRSEMRAYQQADGSVRVPYTCDNSSEAWAQAYLYAVEQMQGGAVAIGSDFNGLAGLPAPRFGSEACGGKADPGYTPVDEVQYGTKSYAHIGTLQQMTIGNKTFDYNTDGLANVGMLPDFIADLQEIGPNDLTSNDLDPLFSSAEAYVHMWESAEDTTPPSVSCGTPSPVWQATDITINCTASDDVAGLADPADAGFTLSTTVATGTETAAATIPSKMVCDTRNNCTTVGPFTGLKVDKKAPEISILVPAATSYVINEQVLASYACTDGGSGLATCAGNVPSGSAIDTATAGSKTFTVTTSDNVNNQDSATVAYAVTYNICVLYDETKAVKSGSAIAIKLALCDANNTNLSSAAIVVHATEVTNLATGVGVPPVAAGDANLGNDFRYDPTVGPAGGYVFNLKTTGLSPGAYSLSFSVAGDPVLHAVPFNVR